MPACFSTPKLELCANRTLICGVATVHNHASVEGKSPSVMPFTHQRAVVPSRERSDGRGSEAGDQRVRSCTASDVIRVAFAAGTGEGEREQ